MITTTLNRIREHNPCKNGWEKLLTYLGKTKADDEPLPYSVIVKSNGLEDALWCCRCEPQHAKEWRLYAVWCARQVQHLMTDARSLNALDVAERYARGAATERELADAAADAWDSAWAAAWDVAWDAADARAAVGAAAGAVRAVRAAAEAAVRAVRTVARDDARAAQTKKFLEIVGER